MSVNESTQKTLLVAFMLCVVCSVAVSSAAVILKEPQELNKSLDKKKNILKAAGLYSESVDIEQAFKNFEARVVNIETGKYDDSKDAKMVNERKAARDAKLNIVLQTKEDLAHIKRISKFYVVYLVKEQGKVKKVILPINGKGLWSTLYGFIALDVDMNTVRGLTFYEHAETPGLGGEVDNPRWKALWNGKKIFGAEGSVKIGLIKGRVNTSKPGAEHRVDGLAGATLTSNGVTNLVRFWMGNKGFGKYIKNMKAMLNPVSKPEEG